MSGKSRAENLSKNQLNKNTIAFMKRVSQDGYTPVLYGFFDRFSEKEARFLEAVASKLSELDYE